MRPRALLSQLPKTRSGDPAQDIAALHISLSNILRNLDDHTPYVFEWTPSLTFTTAGNLSVAYTTRVGTGVKIGRRVFLDFNVVTSTFTHTTAAGNLTMTGLPFVALTLTGLNYVAPCGYSGITKAGFHTVGAQIVSGLDTLTFYASGSGVAGANVAFGDVPTGGTVVLRGSISYTAAQ